jgi:hypothetical protein
MAYSEFRKGVISLALTFGIPASIALAAMFYFEGIEEMHVFNICERKEYFRYNKEANQLEVPLIISSISVDQYKTVCGLRGKNSQWRVFKNMIVRDQLGRTIIVDTLVSGIRYNAYCRKEWNKKKTKKRIKANHPDFPKVICSFPVKRRLDRLIEKDDKSILYE